MAINVTDIIPHQAVYKVRLYGTEKSYKEFCTQNPPCLSRLNPGGRGFRSYTDEKHRKMWATMINVSYDVRNSGFILSKETFEEDNMKVIDGCKLRFVKLMAIRADGSIRDFMAVAATIESAILAQKEDHNLPEMDVLIRALKGTDLPPTASSARTFIKCNYAVMPTAMRTQFLIWVAENLKTGIPKNYRMELLDFCRSYESHNDWRTVITRDGNSAIYETYRRRYYPKGNPLCFPRFVRNALIHLSENDNALEDKAWFILNSYFPNYMSSCSSFNQFHIEISFSTSSFSTFCLFRRIFGDQVFNELIEATSMKSLQKLIFTVNKPRLGNMRGHGDSGSVGCWLRPRGDTGGGKAIGKGNSGLVMLEQATIGDKVALNMALLTTTL
ncbi:hypothetical protein KSS87_000663 [Heliosperma pusillum]|nr:hypothetical protein KSS87_004474 [Heliosperma pusillum]KAH9625977.1 hypothetical protein KSS87_000663 [Heliosperma pusillum]